MRQRRIHLPDLLKAATLLVMVSLVSLNLACQKKCQAGPAEALRTFIDTDFRMVESNDPEFGSLTNTNFIIMKFLINFKGEVYPVTNNEQDEAPYLVFEYNVDPSRKLLRMQYSLAPSDDGSGQGSTGGETQGAVQTYKYALGREFRIVNQANGYFYRMVPYEGVVRPDETCTF